MKKRGWVSVIVGIMAAAAFIRLFQITHSPPSPYWEEAALGYDAYSLLLTRKDHHGNPWPVVALESFGDWKPSGYFYALLPFIKVFGLNVMSVRLPSALAGVGIVAGIGTLAWQLSAGRFSVAFRKRLVLLALFVSALSPWLIQFSRGGWEVNLATLWIVWGVVCGWRAIHTAQKDKRRYIWLMGCALLLVAATYTYHSARLLAPVLGLFFGWQFLLTDIKGRRRDVWLVGYLAVVTVVAIALQPFVAAWGTPALTQRLAEAGNFQNSSLIEHSNALRATHSDSLAARIFYHRYVLAAEQTASQFFSHFRLDFLFVSGDVNPRHSSGYFGLMYPFEIVFLLVGVYAMCTHLSTRAKTMLVLWIVFGILPAALSNATPHALRILPTAPVFLLAISFGVWSVARWASALQLRRFSWWKKLQSVWLPIIGLGYLIFFGAWYRYYLAVYPKRFSAEWQYGYQQAIQAVTQLQNEHPDFPIYITREYGRPAMYYWFYTLTNPALVQQAETTAAKDQGEFLEFQNVHFVRTFSEGVTRPAIVAGSPESVRALLGEQGVLGEERIILDLTGTPVWSIGVAP